MPHNDKKYSLTDFAEEDTFIFKIQKQISLMKTFLGLLNFLHEKMYFTVTHFISVCCYTVSSLKTAKVMRLFIAFIDLST